MASKLTRADRAIVRLADGTVKQQNLLTGTEVWTVPGRGNRPLSAPHADHNPTARSARDATSKPLPRSHASCATRTGLGNSWTPWARIS